MSEQEELVQAREQLNTLVIVSYSKQLPMLRNMMYGMAATCVVLLLAILSLNKGGFLLAVALVSAGIAMPVALLSGSILEHCLVIGERATLSHFVNRVTTLEIGLAFSGVAGLFLFLSFLTLIWSSSSVAAVAFLVASVASIAGWKWFEDRLAVILFSEDDS